MVMLPPGRAGTSGVFIGDRDYLAKLLEHLEQGQAPVAGDQH